MLDLVQESPAEIFATDLGKAQAALLP